MAELIYTAESDDARELVIDFDPRSDLHAASEPSDPETVADFAARWKANLAEIAAERGVTVWVSDSHEQASAGYDEDTEELIRTIWQAAHDRTPVKVA